MDLGKAIVCELVDKMEDLSLEGTVAEETLSDQISSSWKNTYLWKSY